MLSLVSIIGSSPVEAKRNKPGFSPGSSIGRPRRPRKCNLCQPKVRIPKPCNLCQGGRPINLGTPMPKGGRFNFGTPMPRGGLQLRPATQWR